MAGSAPLIWPARGASAGEVPSVRKCPAIAPSDVRGVDALAARQACAKALHQPAKTGVAVLLQRGLSDRM